MRLTVALFGFLTNAREQTPSLPSLEGGVALGLLDVPVTGVWRPLTPSRGPIVLLSSVTLAGLLPLPLLGKEEGAPVWKSEAWVRAPQEDQVLVGCVTMGVGLPAPVSSSSPVKCRGSSRPSCALLCVRDALESRQMAGLRPSCVGGSHAWAVEIREDTKGPEPDSGRVWRGTRETHRQESPCRGALLGGRYPV